LKKPDPKGLIPLIEVQEDPLMSNSSKLKPIAAALGTTFAVSLAMSPMANAAENPFSMSELSSGYMVADAHAAEGKCGEGKCGEGKKAKAEGKCGEGKKAKAEGKCGEGKCGEGKKAEGEGKRGEGKK
jgi:uncharacterized low-complexity protein